MDYNRIQIDSIGIGINDITNLNLTLDNIYKTYLVIGDVGTQQPNQLNNLYNLIVTENAVGVNTTRSNVAKKNSSSLVVEGNINCSGSIHANNIILDDNISLASNVRTYNQILNRISSHLLFYNVKNYVENNIYTTHNVIIGNERSANSNLSAFKIARHCNNNANNIQFAILNNDITNNEPTNLSMGIIGNIDTSPAHILTSPNMPLHFNISKTKTEINNLYPNLRNIPNYNSNQYPSLALDIHGNVIVNKDEIPSQLTYNKYTYIKSITVTPTTEYPKLYINGAVYAENILMFDYITKQTVNLDSIYMRQGNAGGLTIQPNQILGGDFNDVEFTFNSNVKIGNSSNSHKFKIYGNAEITSNLNVDNQIISKTVIINSNLIVNDTGGTNHFYNDCIFYKSAQFNTLNCSETITTKTLNVTTSLIIDGTSVQITDNPNPIQAIPLPDMNSLTLTSYLNVGGKVREINEGNYNSELLNIYKCKDNQKQKFEILLKDTTITPNGSIAYIGHMDLNILQNGIDNSLIFFTELNTSRNNMYFYSGKNKATLKSTIPNLAIMQNNKIGINTITPEKTLDVNGDIISSNYYYRNNTKTYQCAIPIIYNNYNNINNLNININENALGTENYQKLNVKGGINSIDGYYENNNKICAFKYLNSTDAIINNTNIGIGINLSDQNITVPLQIQNNLKNNNKINNSVLSFYRSVDNSKYSGIEFCDDATNLSLVNKHKWYIYKNHVTDDLNYAGPLQIGYMKDSYRPSKSCINLYYDNSKYYIDINNPTTYNVADEFNKNKEDVRIHGNVRISGDLDLDGSINIKGNYKFNDNNILFSPNPVEKLITKIYSLGNNVYYFDTIYSSNHPKNISFKNANQSLTIASNIINHNLNINLTTDIANANCNYIISSNSFILSSNLMNDIIRYSNIDNNVNNNIISNVTINNSTKTAIIATNTLNTNYYNTHFQLNTATAGVVLNNENLLKNAMSNQIYAYSNYVSSSNIYKAIYDIRTNPTTSFISSATLNSNLAFISMSNITTIYNNIFLTDDIIITKLGSNIFKTASEFLTNSINYNNIPSLSPFDQLLLLTSSNKMIEFSNFYLTASDYFTSLQASTITQSQYSNIVTSNYNYAFSNLNNYNFNSNIFITYNNNYSNLNYNIINPVKNITNINFNNIQNNYNDATKIYKTITTSNYSSYATTASSLAIDNNDLNNNITTEVKNYSNLVTNYQNISNISTRYYQSIQSSNVTYNNNHNSNYWIYNSGYKNPQTISLTEVNNIKDNSQSNLTYSSQVYEISDDIYKTFNTISTQVIMPYFSLATAYSNYALVNYINVSNNFVEFSNLYSDRKYISDINNIYNANNCNFIISSNIYTNISNYRNFISNLNCNLNSNIITAQSLSNIALNVYTSNINTNNIKNTAEINNLIFDNHINASNILVTSINIADNVINSYTNFYNRLETSKTIYKSHSSSKVIIATDKILSAINSNLSSYLQISTSNIIRSSNLDAEISSFNNDDSEKLTYYQNSQEVGTGISNIISFINAEKDEFDKYKSELILLFNDYIIEDYWNDAYNNVMKSIQNCINLLTELKEDAINLSSFASELPILLELVLHITNKYINFINTSFDFASSIAEVIEVINNHIGIYIITSLSMLPLLNSLSEYANIFLNRSWKIISKNIVLFASVSYSLNSLIPALAPSDNTDGKNTDVLIIGNTIKLFPVKSLIVGHDNDYSRWLENLDDKINSSAGYFYNHNNNSCACSFNVKANTFRSAFGGGIETSYSLKTSSAIDINLVDTSVANYHDSMFDGVSLKISHIYRRNTFTTTTPSSDNSIFEIVKKNLNKPYFSCYTTINNNNIFNIGSGTFYDINNSCISEDAVLHVNQETTTHLLKLSNPSSSSASSILFTNNLNNWTLAANNKFNFIYNGVSIININSNGFSINTTSNSAALTINSFNDIPALELKNNYNNPLKNSNVILKEKFNVNYNNHGIYYSNLGVDSYEYSKTVFEVDKNIIIPPFSYTLSNLMVSYNNINEINPFNYSNINNMNVINLLPKINLNDQKLSYELINIKTFDISYNYNNNPAGVIIRYITPFSSVTGLLHVSLGNSGNPNYALILETTLQQVGVNNEDYVTIPFEYNIKDINNNPLTIQNNIRFNKYRPFEIETINLLLNNYNYNLTRPLNVVPKSLYNGNHTNTITSNINNGVIEINNTLDYLQSFPINKYLYSNVEYKTIKYPVAVFDNIKDVNLNYKITDYYHLYFDKNNPDTTQLNIEYINTNIKKPLIKQLNIYNHSHNIYSYTDDYELYLDDKKLLNISSIGTLTTAGNIETNNLYLKGDIYNADGISLYDNILSLMNNISSSANLELHSRNIILNPGIGLDNFYRGGVLINGNNINEINNNLFQINNYDGNDNLLTLNSFSQNSYAHFVSKVNHPIDLYKKINSVYRIGNNNGIFGIWQQPLNSNDYNANYYINGTDVYTEALTLNYTNNAFQLRISGALFQSSDKRLKKDIKKIENALEKLIKLNGVTYLNKSETENETQKRNTGLIAQEVNEVLPEAVSTDSNGYYNLAYGNMAGLIIEAIKELKTEIDEIKRRL
jgi:hypothetical protein